MIKSGKIINLGVKMIISGKKYKGMKKIRQITKISRLTNEEEKKFPKNIYHE